MTGQSATYPGACEICAGYWLTYAPQAKAVTIGESEEFMAEVRRCRYCGAHWEVGAFSTPVVISREQAKRELPDLEALEAALAIDFLDSPATTSEPTRSHAADDHSTRSPEEVVKDQVLSRAIVAYLGKGRSAFPRSDADAVRAHAADTGTAPDVLLERVRALVDECMAIKVDWSESTLADAGEEAERVLAARHAELSTEARDALRWAFTYNWR